MTVSARQCRGSGVQGPPEKVLGKWLLLAVTEGTTELSVLTIGAAKVTLHRMSPEPSVVRQIGRVLETENSVVRRVSLALSSWLLWLPDG